MARTRNPSLSSEPAARPRSAIHDGRNGDAREARPHAAYSLSNDRAGTASPAAVPRAVVWASRSEPPEHLFRRLLGAYLGGAREFVVRERAGIGGRTREVVRTFCRRTRQPEVVSEEGGTLALRDLAFGSPVSLDQRIERMGRLVLELHRDAVDSWYRMPFGEDGAWERRDDEIDREAWYVQRLSALSVHAHRDGARVLGPWTVARSLERIADHAVTLGEVGRRLVDLPQGSGPVTSLRQFHEQAMAHLEGALGARDAARANDLLDVGEALIASGESLADRLLPIANGRGTPPATSAAVARLVESISRTIAYAQDIAPVALDRAPAPEDAERRTARRPIAAPAA